MGLRRRERGSEEQSRADYNFLITCHPNPAKDYLTPHRAILPLVDMGLKSSVGLASEPVLPSVA